MTLFAQCPHGMRLGGMCMRCPEGRAIGYARPAKDQIMTDNVSVSELRRLAEGLVEARAAFTKGERFASHRLDKAIGGFNAALTPERVVALASEHDALENIVIAIGIGWDLGGVVEIAKQRLVETEAAFTTQEKDDG